MATEPQAGSGSGGTRVRKSQINVVLFSGGSGTSEITRSLRKHSQIALKILINAYDDGHSTGRLRAFIPGMLGPSDVRKNLLRLMPLTERSQVSLKEVSEYRLKVGISREDALRFVGRIVEGNLQVGTCTPLPETLGSAFSHLACWQMQTLQAYLRTFVAFLLEQEALGRAFDFTDCALGNLYFAGCYLEQGRDFNRTIDAFSQFHDVDPGMLLNITQGENLFLAAKKESGAFVLNEGSLVAAQDSAPISELFLLDEKLYRTSVEDAPEPPDGWGPLLNRAHRVPEANPAAATALREADVIIYGPGTQHSSLFPSYMTVGVSEAIAANATADKVFIGNIHRDFDIQEDDASDLARKLLAAMSRKGQTSVEWRDVVSHFFVQGSDETTYSRAKYVPFDKSRFSFPLETVKERDWEGLEGRHAGGYVLDELRQIVQTRIDVELVQVHHMVSFVLPVLNEAATIEAVLRALTGLDLQPLGLNKEVIVVDGGSTDGTAEKARGMRNVRVFSLPRVIGRGAAMRLGIEKSRGNLIVFFPGDSEYRVQDLPGLIGSLVNSGFRAVFGTRAVKCTDLTDRLKQIYQNDRMLYLTSKYGGMLLSVMTLLLYNRYVSDVLSSVKGYDAELLRSLKLESDGIDLETEIVAKLSHKREYFLEMPLDYKPRTRAEGKKIRSSDGLAALKALIRYRLKA